jgi:hypothetical protein
MHRQPAGVDEPVADARNTLPGHIHARRIAAIGAVMS